MLKRNEKCFRVVPEKEVVSLLFRCIPMSSKRSLFIIITLILLNSKISEAQKTNRGVDISTFIEGKAITKSEIADSAFYLARFENEQEAKQYLEKKTLFIRRLNPCTFIVKGEAAKDLPVYHSLFKTNNLWKISDNLLGATSTDTRVYIYTLKLRYSISKTALSILLPRIKICDVRNNLVLIQCSHEELFNSVLPMDLVVYIGNEAQQAHTEGRVLDLNLTPNLITYLHHIMPDLNGEDITISVKENAFNTNDIDLEGRYTNSGLQSETQDTHATEMATIIGGEGNSFITGKGVAPHVQFTSSSFTILTPDPNTSYTDFNITVQNHSYGTQIENMYGALAEAFDQQVNQLPYLFNVFSSGNDGASASTTGAYAGITGYANLTGNFKMSKNTLSVGSVDTVGRSLSLSSKGPAYDGRIKPELVSYSMAGSSNSAALVSGVATLLQQLFKQKFNRLPTVALQKALLINGAQDIGQPGPDFKTGYGNLNAHQTIHMLKEDHFVEQSVNAFETKLHLLNVPPNVRNLKVTIVWDDVPALVNADVALVNDLDMHVETSLGAKIYPWVLDSSPIVSSLEKPAVRAEDHLNNVEQVLIEAPQTGEYKLIVKANALAGGQQKYAIAYQWELQDEFNWYYPTASDNMPYNGEAGTYFQWSSTLPDENGRLEISLDGGEHWQVIKDNVDLSAGVLRWIATDIQGVAQARMVIGSAHYNTDLFTISKPIIPTVGFNCQDSVMLKWNKVLNAQRYRVKYYVNSTMQDYLITSDTSFVFNKAGSTANYFAIESIFENDKTGIQGYAVDYNMQSSACFLNTFYTQLQPEEGINLLVELGTTYGIEQIIFQRQEGSLFIDIGTVTSIKSTEISYLDTSPLQGLNSYRVQVRFTNGEKLVSDIVNDYFLSTIPFILFPNPISSGAELQILSKTFETTPQVFTLYSNSGTNLFSYDLFSDRESMPLPVLSPGLYLFTIQSEEGLIRGKLLITP
jgi:hypothetical protein